MAWQFAKMHGLGNDFVVIDCMQQSIDPESLPYADIANRHLGIGCDQILLIQPSKQAEFYCLIVNADGSFAEQCGNGLRCVARYVHEHGLINIKSFSIETQAGIFPVTINDYQHIQVTIPVPDISPQALSLSLPAHDTELAGSVVSLGNPHYIVSVNDLQQLPINQWGLAASTHPHFPHGTNVGFVETIDKNNIRLRTYERGAGQTHACGSNACAAVAVGVLDKTLDQRVDVEFKFGKLAIEWHGKGSPIVMTGPASLVFRGEMLSTK